MDRPDPSAGEHGEGAFRNHRHVDRHPVTLRHAHLAQGVGHADHFGLQLGIGDPAHVTCRIVGLEDQRGAGPVARRDMAVDRIVADVEHAVLEPLDRYRIVGPVGDHGRVLDPVEPIGLASPERIAVLDAARVERLVIFQRTTGTLDGCRGTLDPARTILCLSHAAFLPLVRVSLGIRRDAANG